MKISRILLLLPFMFVLFLWTSSMNASEDEKCQPERSLTGNCKQFTEKDLGAIKSGNDSNLMMGVGIISLTSDTASSTGRAFLESASRNESPKGVATITLLNYNLDPSRSLPLEFVKENIVRLLQDNKDNALSYYLNALLLQEEHVSRKALDQIKKGNTYKFNGYSKQRFYAIAKVAEMNQCGARQARELAFWNSHNAAIYLKLRRVCRDLVKELGQDAQEVCFVMGKNLEAASLTCLESIFSLNMQSESLSQSTSDDAARAEIRTRRDAAFACGARTTEIQESAITDEIDKRYYDIYLDKGEATAQKLLADIVDKKQ